MMTMMTMDNDDEGGKDSSTLDSLFDAIESSAYWTRTGGILYNDFDDGHVPENILLLSNNSTTVGPVTRIVDYPSLFGRNPPTVHIYKDALPESIVDALYQKTLDCHYPSWGDYVTMEQVYDYWNKKRKKKNKKDEVENNSNNNNNNGDDDDNIHDHNVVIDEEKMKNSNKTNSGCCSSLLLVETVARYLQLALGEGGTNNQVDVVTSIDKSDGNDDDYDVDDDDIIIDDNNNKGRRINNNFWTRKDLQTSHGVAVWALRAKVGSQVPYHLDYAEQIRYRSNLIVPPLLAGTLQCTRDGLVGGSFKVAVPATATTTTSGTSAGIEHYRKHGYKEKKCSIDDEDGSMIEIPYRYNQLTCHLGNLPHSSTMVQSIDGAQDRVIVGFNVFCHCAGPLVQRAPEHSDTFRRFVQIQKYIHRTASTMMNNDTNGRQQHQQSEKKLDWESVKRNKPLTKLLVLAKRERIKQQHRLSQQQLRDEVPKKLPATVEELVLYFSTTTTSSASQDNDGENKDDNENDRKVTIDTSHRHRHHHPSDVRVFLHHQVLEGKFRIINVGEFDVDDDASCLDGLISPMAKLALN